MFTPPEPCTHYEQTFFSPSANPMQKTAMPPINLVMDQQGLRNFAGLISACVDRAILATKEGK